MRWESSSCLTISPRHGNVFHIVLLSIGLIGICRNKMHQSKAWDNWKEFSDVENASKIEHRKLAQCKIWIKRLSVTVNRHEYQSMQYNGYWPCMANTRFLVDVPRKHCNFQTKTSVKRWLHNTRSVTYNNFSYILN